MVGSFVDSFWISIHSPRMGRDLKLLKKLLAGEISIHSPRMGRDATGISWGLELGQISIHSPRMGRDYIADGL